MNGCQESPMSEDAPTVNPITLTEKKCTKCKETKELSEFNKHNEGKGGLRPDCKDCVRVWRKKYRVANREKLKRKDILYALSNPKKVATIKRRWTFNNPDKVRKSNQRWRSKNPEKMRELQRSWRKNREYTARERLNNSIGNGMRRTIKKGTKNGCHWEKLIGFTVDQLKQHLEKQFMNDMTWENCGTFWHIDHIIPINAFNFEKPEDIDFKRCWALNNLQPLKAIDNLRKSAKINKPFQPSLKF